MSVSVRVNCEGGGEGGPRGRRGLLHPLPSPLLLGASAPQRIWNLLLILRPGTLSPHLLVTHAKPGHVDSHLWSLLKLLARLLVNSYSTSKALAHFGKPPEL